jgi:hypothetical protein
MFIIPLICLQRPNLNLQNLVLEHLNTIHVQIIHDDSLLYY